MTLTLGLSGALRITENVALVRQINRAGDAKLAEIASLAKAYPHAEMGVTDDDHYPDTFLSPFLVFSGHGFHFNAGAWMDLRQDNVSERYAAALFDKCRIPVWILPSHGGPFTLPSYYSWGPLFTGQFRASFAANYKLIKRGGFYNVWACKRPETAAGSPA